MSKDQLRFDGKVAVVTGAGGGLGRAYALFFASRGAKVVVNDLGTSTDGQGKSSSAADKVVEEIKKAGGEAVSNYNSVEDGDLIVKTAIDKWGRIDILINNAGILRDTTFIKMTEKDWDLIYKVHLYGVYKTTKAAWSYMRDQKYGRIIMTTSAAGLYGNFGQANYSSMKLAQVGMASTLAIEGAKTNVFTNTIAPVAGSRMTATVMPPELVDALKPEYIVPLVAFLCHEGSDVNGGIFEVGAGWVSRVRWQRTPGNFYDASSLSPEKIKEGWEKVIDWNGSTNPTSLNESLQIMVAQLQKQQKQASETPQKKKGNENVDVDKVLAHKFEPSTVEITDKEVMLYALAIGEATDPMDDSQLKYVYENHSNFSVIPTMGVLFPFSVLGQLISTPGLTFNPMMLLHAEQYLELKRPIPTSGKLTTTAKVGNIYDKGKAALLTIDANTVDEQNQLICVNQISVYIRGIGGFGGDRGPSTEGQNVPPKKAPDAIRSEKTNANQALLYRLCGDRNPLHADPAMAAVGGFDKPILHGLCFFGYAGRAVLKAFADNDPSKFKSIRARFSKSVFPGETLVTEMWKVSDNQVVFQCKVAERPDAGLVLSNGLVELHGSAVQRSNTSASSNIKANL